MSNIKVVEMDMAPRYVPNRVVICDSGMSVHSPAKQANAYPPGAHPKGCPLVNTCTAIEVVTSHGSRWYGCERAYINSVLRMVAVGFPANFEEMAKWEKVPENEIA